MNKHAYLIIAHDNFYTLEKLIKSIDDSRNDIYIHIDKKIKDFNFKYFNDLVKFSNIYFVERINVYWGHFSLIKAELNLYKEAYKIGYKYYHLISGVDLPIKNQDYIHEFFDLHYGKEFLTNLKPEFVKKQNISDRLNYYHIFQRKYRESKFFRYIANKTISLQRIFNVSRYKFDYNLYYGSNWASLTDKSVKYLISKEKWIYKTFKFTQCCDEVYKQSVIINNIDFRDKLYLYEYNEHHISYNMRHIDWKRGGPYIFRESDYDELMSIESLYARKFNENTDKNIIDKVYNKVTSTGVYYE